DYTEIEFEGMERRVHRVPVSSGNYGDLSVNGHALFFTTRDTGHGANTHLAAVRITNDGPSVDRLLSNIRQYHMAQEGDHLFVRGSSLWIIPATGSGPGDLGQHEIDLSSLAFSFDVREEWRQIFMDAWRNQREIFYDPNMHGLDWEAKREKYLPLVDRVTTRNELNQVINMLMAELSALHIRAFGGDTPEGDTQVSVATLGARLKRDEEAGGYRIARIYRTDPDYPEWFGPLHEPGLDIEEGEIITAINGVSTLSVRHPNQLLRNQAGKQVLLELRNAEDEDETRERIVRPTSDEQQLRYRDWKYSRRAAVEEASDNRLGYVHLSAMGGGNLSEWYRQFYPVFDREGLIIDMRGNRGGNIDSIILGKLLREAWSYHIQRHGEPSWNMQYAFRGHIAVLVDETTSSNGEGFTEGFKRLDLGTVIGKRTWGGYIWINAGRTQLADGGNALAPHMGVYSEDGEWLIERHGVEPDIVVDNLPHATFKGEDAQLDAAIEHLLDKLKEDPVEVPEPPPYPETEDLRF
ncbi:MAG: S41 family peptidase, partial [Candidatus Hydrogenedentota bacterium]